VYRRAAKAKKEMSRTSQLVSRARGSGGGREKKKRVRRGSGEEKERRGGIPGGKPVAVVRMNSARPMSIC